MLKLNKKTVIYAISISVLIIVIASIMEISIRNILKKEEPEEERRGNNRTNRLECIF